MPTTKAIRLPNLSPILPKIIPLLGGIIKPTANTAQVKVSRISESGKNANL